METGQQMMYTTSSQCCKLSLRGQRRHRARTLRNQALATDDSVIHDKLDECRTHQILFIFSLNVKAVGLVSLALT
jgi:hypothetical protein